MSQYPNQVRTVDPFATYNSDTVNKLTRMKTHGEDAIENYMACRGTIVYPDATSIIISSGVIYKDDVRIELTDDTIIDFGNADFYFNFTLGFNEPGYYYVLLEYEYQKSRPAPRSKFVILKPSQRTVFSLSTNWVFLHAVQVTGPSPWQITTIRDYDPTIPANKREYVKVFTGSVTQLPVFQDGDQTRIVYDAQYDKFWFGYKDRWSEGGGGGGSELTNINTSSVNIGDICKIDSTGYAVATIATELNNQADLVVTGLGITDGRGVISGIVEGVPVETGILIDIGDIIYLSATEAGKVTNVRTSPVFQILGRSTSQGSQTTPISMIFSPKVMLTGSFEGTIDTWTASGGSPAYYYDIDISNLDTTSAVLCNFFDDSTQELVDPPKVAYLGDFLRVYNNNNTDVINYIVSGISGGAGGGGGGGGGGPAITNHALLDNLAYGLSGHIGFAPSPHDNTHHSDTYITASGVTFSNLNANGSVGTGAAQVAFGNHTHSQFSNPDIPSGARILFYSNTAITGYNIVASLVDDALVYVVKGTGAGGIAGGNLHPTGGWTQTQHQHSVATHQHTIDHNHIYNLLSHSHSYSGTTGGPDTSFNVDAGGSGGPRASSTHVHTYSGATLSSPADSASTGAPSNPNSGVGGPSTTGLGGTASSWRPFGYCFTLQQRI